MVRKRPYGLVRRPRRLHVRYTEAEFAAVVVAAGRAGLSPTGYVAEAALAAARATVPPATSPLRELAVELMQARTQVRRVGTNLNQAAAQLNATGQAPVWLGQAVRRCQQAVERVDVAAAAVSRRLSPGARPGRGGRSG